MGNKIKKGVRISKKSQMPKGVLRKGVINFQKEMFENQGSVVVQEGR